MLNSARWLACAFTWQKACGSPWESLCLLKTTFPVTCQKKLWLTSWMYSSFKRGKSVVWKQIKSAMGGSFNSSLAAKLTGALDTSSLGCQ